MGVKPENKLARGTYLTARTLDTENLTSGVIIYLNTKYVYKAIQIWNTNYTNLSV